jgi:hypothetical protein
MVDQATAAMAPLLADPDLTATDKLSSLFAALATWKGERRDFLLRLMEVWLSDDNALVRERFRRRVIDTMTPHYTSIVRQGVREGAFDVVSPEHTARVLVSLLLGANEQAGQLYLARRAGLVPFEAIELALGAYPDAIERILGARPGSLRWVDARTLHEWFG